MAGWHTPDTARAQWVDAPLSDDDLDELLSVAVEQVCAYGPHRDVSAESDEVPGNYRRAQLMQARNIWNAAKTDPAGVFGTDEFVIRPYPFDKVIRQLLRPRTGVPRVG